MLIHEFLENCAANLPGKTALVHDGKRLTYGELNSRANQLACALLDLGIERQDRIVILLENSVESVISLYAILKAGAVFVMLNPAMKGAKLNFILKDSGARAIITHAAKASLLKTAASDAPDLEHIIWCGGDRNDFQEEKPRPDMKSSTPWESIFSAAHKLPPRHSRLIDVDLG